MQDGSGRRFLALWLFFLYYSTANSHPATKENIDNARGSASVFAEAELEDEPDRSMASLKWTAKDVDTERVLSVRV